MYKEYPRIGDVTKLRQPCKKLCSICKNPAVAIVYIQNSCFRGDDDVENRCKEHVKTIKPENAVVPVEFARQLETELADKDRQLANGGYEFALDGKPVTLKPEEVDMQAIASSDFAVQSEGSLSIALKKSLSRELVLEGLARELVNKIQFMRKDRGFDIIDRIKVGYEVIDTDMQKDIDDSIGLFGGYITQETLARQIGALDADTNETSEWNINGIKIKLGIAREALS